MSLARFIETEYEEPSIELLGGSRFTVTWKKAPRVPWALDSMAELVRQAFRKAW